MFVADLEILLGLAIACLVITKDVLFLAFHFFKVKFTAHHSLIDVLDIVAGGFKVGGSIIRA